MLWEALFIKTSMSLSYCGKAPGLDTTQARRALATKMLLLANGIPENFTEA